MGQSRKRYAYLDYPLLPQRHRPWGWLLLAGGILGVLAFLSWGRLTRSVSPQAPASLVPETEQVVLVRSAIVTPIPTLLPPPTPIPDPPGDLLDDVDEVEIPWSKREGREEILTYAVQSGDTMWSIASQYGLDVDTLRWSNPDLERNPDQLAPGMELTILPVQGIYYTVEVGDTLSDICQRFGVAEADILNYPLNRLTSPDTLLEGQKLVIPHGRKEIARPAPQLSAGSPFAWPLVGNVTQGFSNKHRAIDIGAPYGSPVYAGREGRVVRAGWARTGYGYTVIIDHGDGLQSLYSHMKGQWVQVGDWVQRGQLIGEVGSTGNSSGPHVHFEVRVNGEQANPVDYLPSGEPK
jgi:murein DD-endopeptidase MepM/ murein hydrolase activator NlpD